MKLRAVIFFYICVQLASLRTEAQYLKQVELIASLDQYTLVEDYDGLISISANEQISQSPRGSENPAIPLIRVSVLVPPGSELTNFSCTIERVTEMENIKLARASLPVQTSRINKSVSGQRQYVGSFPESTISKVHTMVQRGYRWFTIDYSPFEYDSGSRILILLEKVVLNLEYRILPEENPHLRPDPALAEYVKKRVVNPEELDHFYFEDKVNEVQLKSAEERLDYLIITSEALKPAFKPLLEWKTRKGLKATLVTMEDIEKNYDDPGIQLKLKRCIFDYYKDHGLTWVLLGGDSEVVPVQGCYSTARTEFDELIEDWSIPTDLFYACFDGRFDWNSAVDDRIGQLYWDGHDMIPEVYISRIPVNNPEEVENFINKTIRYEMAPTLNGAYSRILLSGVKFLNYWDGKSDSHHRSEHFYSNYFKYLRGIEKVGFYDTGTDFTEGSKYEVTAKNMITQLNNGFGFFHFSGHGDKQYLFMEEGEVFNSDDAMNLVNPVTGIILANACDVNAFDSIDPCLSEAFIRNPVGGGVAFFGSSRYGFDNAIADNNLGPSFKYNANFARYLYGLSAMWKWNSFATIAAMAKSDFAYSEAAAGTMHYLQYAINPIGDPELPLYSADPYLFDNVRIVRYGNELTVNTGGIENARICLTSLNLEDGFQELAENRSFHTFKEIPGSFQVTITAPGFRPYIYRSGGMTSYGGNPYLEVNVYPVPAREYVMIDLEYPAARLQLCDLKGRVLIDTELLSNHNRLDISEFPEGIYILKITSGTRGSIKRIARL